MPRIRLTSYKITKKMLFKGIFKFYERMLGHTDIKQFKSVKRTIIRFRKTQLVGLNAVFQQ